MSKYFKSLENKFDRNSSYSISEAIDILLSIKRPSFAESVDVAFNLGVNPRHAEENIRLSINLPNGVGREVSVLAIVNADKEQEAKDAGADLVGKEEFLEKIKNGWADVDRIVCTPDLMLELGKLGKILGPKGLMPNPKSGTVTTDIANSIKELKAGKIDARVEKNGILHSSIGKTSFSEVQLKENFDTFKQAVLSAKPNSFKGKYLKSISISSTHGPGIKVEID
jgi:large subunit ribosomal protein L1